MILAGINAGNSPRLIIIRAVSGLFAGYVLGGVVGWVGMILVRDNLPAPVSEDEPQAAESEPVIHTVS